MKGLKPTILHTAFGDIMVEIDRRIPPGVILIKDPSGRVPTTVITNVGTAHALESQATPTLLRTLLERQGQCPDVQDVSRGDQEIID